MTLTPIPQSDILYRGYIISPVFNYKNLKGEYLYSDFNVFREDAETGTKEPRQTLDEVKASIDEIIDMETERKDYSLQYEDYPLGVGA